MASQNQEPTLRDLMNDPMVILVMKRDGVDRKALWRTLIDIKLRLQFCRRKLSVVPQRLAA